MSIDIYSSFFMQIVMFALLAVVLLVSTISLFIKPAKRVIRASLVNAKNGKIVDISRAETSIGRAKTCDVIINDMAVSRFHAVLSKRKNGWIIFDTHSTSGTVVNGKIIDKKEILEDGDSIYFGNTEYIFYSTAVTTRQQIVPKNGGDRPKYKRPVSSSAAEKSANPQNKTRTNKKK